MPSTFESDVGRTVIADGLGEEMRSLGWVLPYEIDILIKTEPHRPEDT